MKKEQEQQYNTSENVEEIFKERSDLTITNEQLENTPFRIVGNKQQGYCLTLGKYKVTDTVETEEKAIAILDEKAWIVMANMIVLMYLEMKKEEEDEKKTTL